MKQAPASSQVEGIGLDSTPEPAFGRAGALGASMGDTPKSEPFASENPAPSAGPAANPCEQDGYVRAKMTSRSRSISG